MTKGMRMPGFAAECSLRPASKAYCSYADAPEGSSRVAIIPQMECMVEEYLGKYYVCCCSDDPYEPCDCTGIV